MVMYYTLLMWMKRWYGPMGFRWNINRSHHHQLHLVCIATCVIECNIIVELSECASMSTRSINRNNILQRRSNIIIFCWRKSESIFQRWMCRSCQCVCVPIHPEHIKVIKYSSDFQLRSIANREKHSRAITMLNFEQKAKALNNRNIFAFEWRRTCAQVRKWIYLIGNYQLAYQINISYCGTVYHPFVDYFYFMVCDCVEGNVRACVTTTNI